MKSMYWLKEINNLGVSLKDLRRSEKEILKYNLKMLRNFTSFVAPLVFVFIFLALTVKIPVISYPVVITFACITVCFAIESQYDLKRKRYSRMSVLLLIALYDTVAYAFTIYIGTFANRENVGSTFIIFVICLQTIYVMPPSWNFIRSIVPTLAFMSISMLIKTPDIYLQDIRNAVVAVAIGILLNNFNGREKVQLICSKEKLAREFEQLHESSEMDALTGVFNRLVTQRKLQEYCKDCADEKASIFAAMVDVDFFKKYNDTYGHSKGDDVLNFVGKIMGELSSEYDIIAGRIGGEEFLLAGRAGSRLQATRIADKLRYGVESAKIEHQTSDAATNVTISIGVAFAPLGTYVESREIYEKADEALYQAKKSGRNCVKTVTL